MFNFNMILLGADHDCDGTGYFAHRISVPARLVTADLATLRRYASESGQITGMGLDMLYDSMTFAAFRKTDTYAALDAWERDYLHTEGYASLGNDWYPWAGPDGDDSIGISALDHTMEDAAF